MYDTNWEWIMEVVQKIYKTHPQNNFNQLSITTPIHTVFIHCFNYVQWYFDYVRKGNEIRQKEIKNSLK